MIYLTPNGGLGNMFFEIASIWTLAKDNNDELCLLNVENNTTQLINIKNRNAINYEYIFNRFLNKNIIINESIQYPFYYMPLEYKNGYKYIGYFQSEKYFKHRRNEILKLFKSTNEIDSKVNEYQHLFGNISLHVRRGDYVNSQVHPIQLMKYYEESLSLLPKNIQVLVFSDDLEWCRKNLKNERYLFIDEEDCISIYLMSKMKYHIIANSSFSWWSAWMSEYNDKIIISPKKWFCENTEYDGDLVPNNWIRI